MMDPKHGGNIQILGLEKVRDSLRWVRLSLATDVLEFPVIKK